MSVLVIGLILSVGFAIISRNAYSKRDATMFASLGGGVFGIIWYYGIRTLIDNYEFFSSTFHNQVMQLILSLTVAIGMMLLYTELVPRWKTYQEDIDKREKNEQSN